MSNPNTNSGGIGFVGLLTILFIGLKLTKHIDWSWWWVLSPIWICVSVAFAVFIVGGGIMFFAYWLDNRR